VEALLALKLDHIYDKKEILELYLNGIYLGHGTYGVEAAARYYLGKSARDLTLGESALLAGLINSPETHSPRRNLEEALRWRRIVLARMLELGWANPESVEAAASEEVQLAPRPAPATRAPYFVDYVVQLLEKRHPAWEGRIPSMGLKIYTTLDMGFQEAANEAVRERLQPLQEPAAGGVPQPQAAVVALDPADGSVMALVGGSDYALTQLNRAVVGPGRQPGSAFKPIVYAALLDSGHTLLDRAACEPVTYQLGTETYTPTDYGSQPYHHRELTVRESLVLSDNVTTVRWTDRVGPATVVQYARRMGVESPLSPTLSIGLGAYEVTPLELARVYAVLANGGWRVEPQVIRRVEARSGMVLDSGQATTREQVLSAEVAFLLTDALADVLQNGTASHLGPLLDREAAGKTGTSQGQHDAWFAGYTRAAVVVVWVGNDLPDTLPGTGGTLAGPIWVDVIRKGHGDRPDRGFEPPTGVHKVRICQASGLLPATYPAVYDEWFVRGTEPDDPCPAPPQKWWERLIDFIIDEWKKRGNAP